MSGRPRGRIVYSTDPEPEPESRSSPAPGPRPKSQTVYVERDRKRRRGKTVTVVSGIIADDETLRDLLKTLQKRCGAGGTAKDGEIEIQGDHRERVAEYLGEVGYKVKFRGG
ncbi:MAG: translation initiation factor [Anaerolineae bacterium]